MTLLVVALNFAMTPAMATATSCPSLSDGGMVFPEIQGPEGPEDYCWEVEMSHDQELVWIDDRHAAVYYNDSTLAFSIEAPPAHDVEGTTVPTTIAVSQGNLITLTVHHRAGNPAAGGAPFDYPIIEGTGWEGGFHTTEIQLAEPQPAAAPEAPSPPL